jgi:hypothetical protein
MEEEVEHVDRETDPQEAAESRSSRVKFLRRLGVTLAAGVGAATFASVAHAAGRCCHDCSCGTCQGGCRCFCNCGGIGDSYCWTSVCLASGCVGCPC